MIMMNEGKTRRKPKWQPEECSQKIKNIISGKWTQIQRRIFKAVWTKPP
jgi:hypothetical protein